jgi:hypothetical protein
MNITFRPARAADRKVFDWKPFGLDQERPRVISIDGKVAVMLGENRTVLYQYGNAPVVANLIRAWDRICLALTEYTEEDRFKLSRQGQPNPWDFS